MTTWVKPVFRNGRVDAPYSPLNETVLNQAMTALDEVKNGGFSTAARGIVLLGTSITRQSFNATGLGSFDVVGYWTWAQLWLEHRFELLANSGVSGNKTADMLARLSTDVLAYNPGYCVVECGPNDMTNDVASATTITNLQAIYDALRAAGIKVIACTATPSSSMSTTARKNALFDVNRWIRNYARTTKGIILCDWYNAFADPATVQPLAALTTDGTHPIEAGAYWMGKFLAGVLDQEAQRLDRPLPWSNADYLNILANPRMTGNTAGLATGCTVGSIISTAPTTTNTKVARTDGVQGEWQQVNASAAPDGWQLSQDDGGAAAGVLWNIGDSVYGVAEVEIDAGGVFPGRTGEVPIALQILCHGPSSVTQDMRGQTSYGTWPAAIGASEYPTGKLVVRTPTIAIPATTDKLFLRVQSYLTGANVRVGAMGIRKVLAGYSV